MMIITLYVIMTTQDHPYFARSIPSDMWQAKALVNLIGNFGWTQVRFCFFC